MPPLPETVWVGGIFFFFELFNNSGLKFLLNKGISVQFLVISSHGSHVLISFISYDFLLNSGHSR